MAQEKQVVLKCQICDWRLTYETGALALGFQHELTHSDASIVMVIESEAESLRDELIQAAMFAGDLSESTAEVTVDAILTQLREEAKALLKITNAVLTIDEAIDLTIPRPGGDR